MRDRTRRHVATLALLFSTSLLDAASAEPVTTIRDHGSSANRVDMVILGDGYTQNELGKYATDVDVFVDGFFAQEPFREYQRYFNVHRIDVISNDSGSDHPDRNPQVFKNTALDSTYNCAGIQRLICVNTSKVNTVLASSVSAEMRDLVLVIVNDAEYGGSGGSVAVASIHSAAVEVILHEIGHTLGLLADEYGGGGPSCNPFIEPSEPNATKETVRGRIKWTYWIDSATPVPTPGPTVGEPGLYEEAKYCYTGLFRPTFDSKMRSLSRPFEQINSEQLVKRVYNWASPIDVAEPPDETIMLEDEDSQTFHVRTPLPLTHDLVISWTIDGAQQATGSEFTLDASGLSLGSHAVEVVVADPTALVRSDPADVLTQAWSWDVVVVSGGSDLVEDGVSSPPAFIAPGGAFTVSDTVRNQGSAGASASKTQYYLSLDAAYDPSDQQLMPGRFVPELAAGASSTGATTVRVPGTAALGTYTLLACADAALDVNESDEMNNCLAAAAQITVARPDLKQTTIANPPAAAAPGSKLAVSDTVQNPSSVTAFASATRYYLSADAAKNTGDVLLTGKRPVPELVAGLSNTGTTTVTIPSAVTNGSYYVLACADDLMKLKEEDETNNCAPSAATILIGFPDLVTTAVSDPPAILNRGGKFMISDTVLNQGTIPAGAFATRYYLSSDAVKSAGDVLLAGARSVLSLAAGQTDSGSRRVTVPLAAPPGTYRVLACADDSGKVSESDNSNNCRASATTVAVQ